MTIWTDQESIRGIVVKATFFDADAAQRAKTHAERTLPFMVGAALESVTAGHNRQTIHYGDLSAEPDAIFALGDGLIVVQLANDAALHTPERWRQQIDVQNMLNCVMAGYVVAQLRKKVTACVLRYHNAAYLLTPTRPVVGRTLGLMPIAKKHHNENRRLSVMLLAEFACTTLFATAAFGASDDDDNFMTSRSIFSDDDDTPSITASRSSFDDDGIGIGSATSFDSAIGINPASGLPMMDSCFDVAGNTFGTSSDSFGSDSFGSSIGSSDSFGSDSFGSSGGMGSGSMFDD